MGILTYTSLIRTIKDIIEDDSTEVSAFIPTAILLAQERVNKDIDTKKFARTTSVTTSMISNVSIGVSGYETIVSTCIQPQEFLSFRSVYFNGEKLDQVDVSFTKEINRYETTIGCSARYYAFLESPNKLYIAPPVSAGKFSLQFNQRVPKLSSSNDTNVIIEEFPELLFYAALSEMSKFLKNWQTVGAWDNAYVNLLTTNLNTTRKERTEIGQKHMSTGETQSTTGAQ